MKKRKEERRNHFIDVLEQIEMIRNEINGSTESVSSETVVDETDLSLTRLEELHRQLHDLLKEKVNFFSILYCFHLMKTHAYLLLTD